MKRQLYIVRFLGILVAVAIGSIACEAQKEAVESGEEKKKAAASTAEADTHLRSVGDGAMVYFQEEHASGDGMTVTTRVFPLATAAQCTAGGEGEPVEPSATDFRAGVWRDLRFSISKPHSFRYCYRSSADGKAFAAWAAHAEQVRCITGATTDGAPAVTPTRTVGSEAECAF